MKQKSHPKDALLALEDAPFMFVEAYKSFRTNLQFVSINNHYKKIIVTSSLPKEGKSTVAINLALSLVNNGSRVLLIDADLRKPMIKQYLNLGNKSDVGLTDIISESHKPEQTILSLEDKNLHVLSSGCTPPNPSEILGSEKMHQIIQDVEKDYDYLIFDTPPVTVVTDAAVLSKWCDGVILVVKQKFTEHETAQLAKNKLTSVGANIIGCVLNDFKPTQSNKSYMYYNYTKHNYYNEYSNVKSKVKI